MTGATGVMGPPVVEAFLALGAEVLAAGHRRTELDALRAAMGQHERLEVAEHDPCDAEGTANLFDAWTRKGNADVLVHATPGSAAGTLTERAPAGVRVELDGALFGAAVVLREGLRRMGRDPSGSVVVLCVGGDGSRDDVAGVAEAGVLHLVEASARESDARVNAVLVGTSLEEAARATAWLASDDGRGVHGARVRMR